MKTDFPQRTAYHLSDKPVPDCFLRLDEHFERVLPGALPRGAATHVAVLLAESICARMAEVELYAFLIEDARKRPRLDTEGDANAAILTRAYFVAYLGACRALLDSLAGALVNIHEMGLPRNERTFASPHFWQVLVERSPNVHRRYQTQRIFFNEVFRWCNEVQERVVPLEVVYTAFGHYSTRDSHTRVLDENETDYLALAYNRGAFNWVDPLQIHDRWKTQFLTLCERLCKEIESLIPLQG
jgi:hypothetical protein